MNKSKKKKVKPLRESSQRNFKLQINTLSCVIKKHYTCICEVQNILYTKNLHFPWAMLEVAFKALLTFNFKAKSADDKKQARENCVSQLNRIATMFFFLWPAEYLSLTQIEWRGRLSVMWSIVNLKMTKTVLIDSVTWFYRLSLLYNSPP